MIKMGDLKKTFESLGFDNVKTLLASGNVLFETPKSGTSLVKKLRKNWKRHLDSKLAQCFVQLKKLKTW